MGARLEFVLLFQAVPRDRPLARGGGWQVGLPWDGCGWKLEHQKRGGDEGEELKKKGGEALDFCDAPGPASPAAFLGTTVAFQGRKRTGGATARRTLLEAGLLCIHKALRVAGLRRGICVSSALLGQAEQPGTYRGQGNLGASLGARGSLGSAGAR